MRENVFGRVADVCTDIECYRHGKVRQVLGTVGKEAILRPGGSSRRYCRCGRGADGLGKGKLLYQGRA